MEHTFTKVNYALQGLQNQWQPVTEQVRFIAFNIRILVQSNEECRASLAALQAQVNKTLSSMLISSSWTNLRNNF